MRRRKGDRDEEGEGPLDEPEGPPGDLGTMLLHLQEGAGNAAVAGLLQRVENGNALVVAGPLVTHQVERPGERPAPAEEEAVDPERRARRLEDLERRRAAMAPSGPALYVGPEGDAHTQEDFTKSVERATFDGLRARVAVAKLHPSAHRLADDLASFHRRLNDAREYGWLGTDGGTLATELDRIEAKLGAAAGEEEAMQALAAVDGYRLPLSQRAQKATLERTALAKPGMSLYAPEDAKTLEELDEKLGTLQKRLAGNRDGVAKARATLGTFSTVANAAAKQAAATQQTEAETAGKALDEHEAKLKEIADRHAKVNSADRERLNKLMDGLSAKNVTAPRKAMAGQLGKTEVEYLVKKAWLEQFQDTQKLNKDELWEIVTGVKPESANVHYVTLTEKMGKWPIHLSLDYGVMRAVAVGDSEQDIKDALMGATAAVTLRSHVTAEALRKSDDRNPHFYYGTTQVSPRREFWDTPEGEEADANWDAYEGQLMAALGTQATALAARVVPVLAERAALRAKVVKVSESLTWTG